MPTKTSIPLLQQESTIKTILHLLHPQAKMIVVPDAKRDVAFILISNKAFVIREAIFETLLEYHYIEWPQDLPHGLKTTTFTDTGRSYARELEAMMKANGRYSQLHLWKDLAQEPKEEEKEEK